MVFRRIRRIWRIWRHAYNVRARIIFALFSTVNVQFLSAMQLSARLVRDMEGFAPCISSVRMGILYSYCRLSGGGIKTRKAATRGSASRTERHCHREMRDERSRRRSGVPRGPPLRDRVGQSGGTEWESRRRPARPPVRFGTYTLSRLSTILCKSGGNRRRYYAK